MTEMNLGPLHVRGLAPFRSDGRKVYLILPGLAAKPVGGFRVAYEYANRLSRVGYHVGVFHELPVAVRSPQFASVWNAIPGKVVRSRIGWFEIDSNIDLYLGIPGRHKGRQAPPDVYLLTAWQTARHVGTLYSPAQVVHLVYDYEFWHDGSDDLRARMRTAFSIPGVRYVATSTAVEEMLRECGTAPVATIRAGLDADVYYPDPLIERRSKSVGVLLRTNPRKGTGDALRCLAYLRAAGRVFQAFGTGGPTAADVLSVPSPDDAAMRAFYSRLEIFLSLSTVEAWGLPALEAMACGAAVVLADNIGCRDFAVDGQNCLIVPPGRPDMAAQAVDRLLRDPKLRMQLVEGGAETARALNWDKPVAALDAVLGRLSSSQPRAGQAR